MKSILIVNSGIGLGGGESVSNGLASALNKDINCLAWFSGSGAAPADLEKHGVKTSISETNPILSLRSLLKSGDFDCVHAQGTRAAFWVKCSMLLGAPRIKFVYTLHGIHFIHRNFLYRKLFGIFERITNYFLVDVLVCVSEDDYNLAKRLKLISEGRFHLVKNGIDVSLFQDKTQNANKEMVIGTVCRLEPPKEVGTIIDALDKIPFKTKFVIVGDGSLRPDLEKRALKCCQEIVFLGFQSNIPELLGQMDVFVLSSKWEGLPVSILEAMSASKPVLGSNVSGIRELIKDGENGFLFENADDLADKLISLEDKQLRSILGENGRKWVESNYSLDKMVREYKTLYENSRGK